MKQELELPSHDESAEALSSGIAHLLKIVRQESFAAAWWSWFLLCLSLFYVVIVIALDRSFFARAVIFALTTVSLIFFVIGVLAPAMVIWTAPEHPHGIGQT